MKNHRSVNRRLEAAEKVIETERQAAINEFLDHVASKPLASQQAFWRWQYCDLHAKMTERGEDPEAFFDDPEYVEEITGGLSYDPDRDDEAIIAVLESVPEELRRRSERLFGEDQ